MLDTLRDLKLTVHHYFPSNVSDEYDWMINPFGNNETITSQRSRITHWSKKVINLLSASPEKSLDKFLDFNEEVIICNQLGWGPARVRNPCFEARPARSPYLAAQPEVTPRLWTEWFWLTKVSWNSAKLMCLNLNRQWGLWMEGIQFPLVVSIWLKILKYF